MRRFLIASGLAVLTIACSDSPTSAPVLSQLPSAPQGELIEPTDRIEVEVINSHTYGSFAINSSTTGGVIMSGPANFPGHPPAGPGTCKAGLWINAQGKPTAGSLDHPHPHCVTPESATEVVLEPISSCFTGFRGYTCRVPASPAGQIDTYLQLGYTLGRSALLQVHGVTVFGKDGIPLGGSTDAFLDASLWVTGFAIDVATGRRVGYLSFDLGQYASKDRNFFDDACAIDEGLESPCLNPIITAFYKPFPPEDGGIGAPGSAVGFLWFTPATAPYNYGR